VDDHPGGLVDDEHVLVLEDDRDVDRPVGHRRPVGGRRHVDLEDVAGHELARPARHRAAVDPDTAGIHDLVDLAAGQPREERHRPVHPLAAESPRNGDVHEPGPERPC